MAIEATFEHDDGYRYIIIYSVKKKFIQSMKRLRHAVFIHAIDYDKQIVVYPSTLPEYCNV